jgi:hypothetical protein
MWRRARAQHAPRIFESMMHLAIGFGLLGFILARRHRYRHFHACGGMMRRGCGWEGGWEGERGWGGRGGRGLGGRARMWRRFVMRRVFATLDTSPAQERAILAELDQLEQTARAAGELLRGGQAELAQVMGSAELDEQALAAATSRIDAAAAQVRDGGVGALRAVHALLDDPQRARLAELLERKPWWRGGGMYR